MVIKRKQIISADAPTIWQFVKDFRGAHKWFPEGQPSEMTNNSDIPGTERIISKDTEYEIRERLLSIDEVNHILTYSIVKSPLPIQNHKAVISVQNETEDKSLVVWEATFDANEEARAQMEELMGGAFETGLNGLNNLIKNE